MTPDGKVWCGYKLSESTVEGGACSVPASLKQFINGKFLLKTPDGVQIGNIITNGSNVWGLREFFRRRGGEAGDFMVLEFDLKNREVTAYIGEENLLEDFQPDE